MTRKEDGSVPICSDKFVSWVRSLADIFYQENSPADAKPESSTRVTPESAADDNQAPSIDIGLMYRSLLYAMEEHSECFGANKPYFDMLHGLIPSLSRMDPVSSVPEAIRIIRTTIEGLTSVEEERPDQVTVTSLSSVSLAERRHQFVIGLSFDSFEPNATDSPVLSDRDLLALLDSSKGYVQLSSYIGKNKREDLMTSLDAQPEGTAHISACTFDTVNFRQTAVSEAYKSLLDRHSMPEEEIIVNRYPNIPSGNGASIITSNASDYFPAGSLDASIREIAEVITDESDGHLVYTVKDLSPTSLQTLMECPLEFLYKKSLNLQSEKTQDSGVWLSPTEKGTLYHGVLEAYCNQVLKGKSPAQIPSDVNQEVLTNIYESWNRDFRILIAAGSDSAYQLERADMIEDIKTYLEGLHKELKADGWTVMECEKEIRSGFFSYDLSGKPYQEGAGEEIRISFYGFADRVDCRSVDGEEAVNEIRIIDYKTGRMSRLRENITDGKQIQHLIYAMALEQENGSEPATHVAEFDYMFPCDKNRSIRIGHEELQGLFPDTIELLANVVVNENYDYAEKADCKWCDYSKICLRKLAYPKEEGE